MPATGNALLDGLPEDDFALFGDSLRRVHLPHGKTLLDPGEATDHADFPIGAVLSLTTGNDEDQAIEVAMIGPEGMLGLWSLSGFPVAPWRVVAQVDGDLLRCTVAELRSVFAQSPDLRDLLQRSSLAQSFLMSQSILCNRFHELPQRAARWLLIVRAKSGRQPLPMTQEFLSQMLGVHRPSVTLALQTLAEAGLIRNEGRGRIRILDAQGLEGSSCACFRRAEDFQDAVMGGSEGSWSPS